MDPADPREWFEIGGGAMDPIRGPVDPCSDGLDTAAGLTPACRRIGARMPSW
jgi:hypothetical protein